MIIIPPIQLCLLYSQFQLPWCCTHPAAFQGPHVAAFSVVVGVLRLVTSTQGLLAGRDVMMAASFSLQDPLGVFLCLPTNLHTLLLHHWLLSTRYPNLLILHMVQTVLCSLMHEKVVLFDSRSVFLMENNGWFVCSYGAASGKPMSHLLSSYSCTPPPASCASSSQGLCHHSRSVFSPCDIIYVGYIFCSEQ